jgi:RNA polymerase sigma factor (sigma-70 family)
MTTSAVALATMSRGNYEPGSFGYEYFPEILEGRERPADFDRVPLSINPVAWQRDTDTITVADVWASDTETVRSQLGTSAQRALERRLTSFSRLLAEKYMLLPQARLIHVVLGEPQGPVDPSQEPQIRDAVEEALDQLDPRLQDIIRRRFGLDTWQVETLEEVGAELRMHRERVRQIETRGLSILRHPNRVHPLEYANTFTLHALARQIPGASVFKRDFPEITTGIVTELGLSESSMAALGWIQIEDGSWRPFNPHAWAGKPYNARDVAEADTTQLDANQQAEIAAKLYRYIRLHRHEAIFEDLLDEVVELSLMNDAVLQNLSIRRTARTAAKLSQLTYSKAVREKQSPISRAARHEHCKAARAKLSMLADELGGLSGDQA